MHENERWCMWILAIFGIFVNVIPKFIKDDGARRHVVTIAVNRRLLIHILSGIVTVLGNGFIGINGGYSQFSNLTFWLLAASDFIHQLSIITLLKNHDGIYALRVGNLASAILKFHTLLNHHSKMSQQEALTSSDILFTASFGFMGTRLASFLSYITFYLMRQEKWLQFEHWYSIGLGIAQFHIMMRIPNFERMIVLTLPLTAHWFYHELWKKNYKPLFTSFNIVYAGLVLGWLATPQLLYAAIGLYYAIFFFLPLFHRFPEQALKQWKLTGRREILGKSDEPSDYEKMFLRADS